MEADFAFCRTCHRDQPVGNLCVWKRNNRLTFRGECLSCQLKRWNAAIHKQKRKYKPKRSSFKQHELDQYSPLLWEQALNYFGNRCAVCGRTADLFTTLARDHWIPYSKGGQTTVDNIIPLCNDTLGTGCNQRKGTQDALIWLTKQYGAKKAKQISERIQAYLTTQHKEGSNSMYTFY